MNYITIILAASAITLIHKYLINKAYKEGIRDGSLYVMDKLHENYDFKFTITPDTIEVNNMKGSE